MLLPWVARTKLLLASMFLGGVYLARNGGWCSLPSRAAFWAYLLMMCLHRLPGSWLHGMLPPVLQEGSVPSQQEVASHDKSLFTPRLSSEALNEQWHVALDSLAWSALLDCGLGLVCRGSFAS